MGSVNQSVFSARQGRDEAGAAPNAQENGQIVTPVPLLDKGYRPEVHAHAAGGHGFGMNVQVKVLIAGSTVAIAGCWARFLREAGRQRGIGAGDCAGIGGFACCWEFGQHDPVFL